MTVDTVRLVEQAREREDYVGLGMLDLVDAVRRRDELVAGLADAVEELQTELRTMTGNRDRGDLVHREALAKWAEARARVADLEAGIANHRNAYRSVGSFSADRRLWALLDSEEDDDE